MGKMKTRTLPTEIIFNLSPNNSISQALKNSGITANDTSILTAFIEEGEKHINQEDVISQIESHQVSLKNLLEITNITEIKRYFLGILLNVITCRMSTKDVLWDDRNSKNFPASKKGKL